MSHKATNWAFSQRGLGPSEKLVLLYLADRHNPDYGCFPSQRMLAEDAEVSPATVNRSLQKLEEAGLIRRIQRVDPRTRRQLSTRYILGFEPEFTQEPTLNMTHGPEGTEEEQPEEPCLNLRDGSRLSSEAEPTLISAPSRLSNCDTNLVREPLREPVKEEEGARARDPVPEDFFAELLAALGLDAAALPGWWQGWPPREHVRRWRDDLDLDEDVILAVAEASRRDHPDPPDGPKALDRAMERAAQAARRPASGGGGTRRRKRDDAPTPGDDDLAAFYAGMVNADGFLPPSMIGNAMRDAMLSRGLVTAERLRERGVR